MPRRSIEGQRAHVIIPNRQDRELRKLADETGLTISEHIRRAIDQYLLALKKER